MAGGRANGRGSKGDGHHLSYKYYSAAMESSDVNAQNVFTFRAWRLDSA